jgi:hypothetical protein
MPDGFLASWDVRDFPAAPWGWLLRCARCDGAHCWVQDTPEGRAMLVTLVPGDSASVLESLATGGLEHGRLADLLQHAPCLCPERTRDQEDTPHA